MIRRNTRRSPIVDNREGNVGGWADLNVRYAMLIRFYKHWSAGRQIILGYCGDHDPGGLNISDWLRSNLFDIGGAVARYLNVSTEHSERMISELVIERFGLNADFINQPGLIWIDNLETSSGVDLANRNHPDHHKAYVQNYLRLFGRRKCEANALVINPTAGRNLCADWILQHIPAEAVNRYYIRLGAPQTLYKIALEERFGVRVEWPGEDEPDEE